MAENEEKKKTAKPDPVFTKEQLVASARFADYRDALNALLDDGVFYTIPEAESILQGFLKH